MEGILILHRESPLISFFKTVLAEARRQISALFSQAVPSGAVSTAVSETAEHLLDAYGNSILRLAYSYLHNMEDAEEVVQDTLLQYLQTAPTFTDLTHEKAWCLRVAGNLAKNRIKYNRVRDADELNEELVAEDREDLSFVWEAVKSLPVKYREVVHLFYHEGYSTAEIADILKMNEATVRSNLSRGRAKLKEVLKEAYDFDR